MMPGMSGLELVRKSVKYRMCRFFFLTAKAQESDKLIGLMAGRG